MLTSLVKTSIAFHKRVYFQSQNRTMATTPSSSSTIQPTPAAAIDFLTLLHKLKVRTHNNLTAAGTVVEAFAEAHLLASVPGRPM